MAVKSEIWVHATIRRCNAEGLFAAVVKRGASEAGAIYVIIDKLDGTCRLLGPAPGPAYDEAGVRRWVDELPPASSPGDVSALLERRKNFDSDIWIIEIADRNGTAGLVPAK